ncbi:MAG: tetratricopeptide repeat protein, partial [Planctomycetaceae bacterium]
EAALTQRQRGLPLEFDSRITAGLKSILRKCLAPDLSDRYPSAVELAEDVEREEQNLPLLHAREGLWSGRIAKLTRRNPRTFSTTTTAFIAAIMVLALLMGLTRYRGQAQRLAATQSYARFIAGSDRALTSYLTADSEYEDRAVRMNLTRSAFDVFELNGTTERTNWRNGVRFAKLTAEEQDRVDERLFVLASLALEDAWDPESTASTGVDQEMLGACRQVFESLPAWSRDTTTYRLAARRWESTSPERRAPLTLGNLAASPAAHPADRLVCAIALIGSERFDDVLRLLDEPKLVQSLGVVYWLTAGRAELEKGDLRDAVLSFTFAIGNMPGGVAGYFNRGLAHFRLGELEAAKRDFTSALKLESRFAPALVNRSFCHAASSDHELALADLNAALELSPRSNRLLLLRSRQLKQLGREAEGRQDFDEALRASPQSIQDYVSLGLAWLPDDPRQSLAVLQRAERRYGVHPMILQSQAHVYSEHLNEPAGALEALNRLLDESPLFLKALAGRGVLLARRENVEGALADAQRVESQSRVLPAEIVYQLACVYALGCKTRPELSRPALRRLAEALRRGYGAELLDSDPDLAEVRGLSAFQSLRSAARLFSER